MFIKIYYIEVRDVALQRHWLCNLIYLLKGECQQFIAVMVLQTLQRFHARKIIIDL